MEKSNEFVSPSARLRQKILDRDLEYVKKHTLTCGDKKPVEQTTRECLSEEKKEEEFPLDREIWDVSDESPECTDGTEYLPSLLEIKRTAARIRSTWTERERLSRITGPLKPQPVEFTPTKSLGRERKSSRKSD